MTSTGIKILNASNKKEFEIGRILHLKFEIRNPKLDAGPFARRSNLRFRIEMRDSSNFKFFFIGVLDAPRKCYCLSIQASLREAIECAGTTGGNQIGLAAATRGVS
jgi:hypothetical protein